MKPCEPASGTRQNQSCRHHSCASFAWLHDAARYWSAHTAFSSADAPALWSPHQASRISLSSGTCSLPPHWAGGFNQTFQYNLLTNDLLLPQRSHDIPICPKHEFLFPTRSSHIKMLIRSPWMQQMKPVAPLISPWHWGKGSAFRTDTGWDAANKYNSVWHETGQSGSPHLVTKSSSSEPWSQCNVKQVHLHLRSK